MALKRSELSVGDRHSMVVVEDLTRTQLAQYAGASGDFNPLHTDEVYATKVAGYPTVFAHGMLTMGLTARMLTDWVGDEQGWLSSGDVVAASPVVHEFLLELIANNSFDRPDMG